MLVSVALCAGEQRRAAAAVARRGRYSVACTAAEETYPAIVKSGDVVWGGVRVQWAVWRV